MPSRFDDLAKSENNERLSLDLQSTAFVDWSVTSLFYSALHLIDAWLDDSVRPAHPANHTQRKRLIQTDPVLRLIGSEYLHLEDRSRDARYECAPFTVADVEQLRRTVFVPLKNHIHRALL